MKSPEKVLAMVEQLQDAEDHEIGEALPIGIPPTLLRGALLLITDQIPHDANELDAFLEQVSEFCMSLRSDHEPAAT